ncbi:hypothetical protein FVE85_1419 [Porphyridium purpureum]|uniref:Uncharacterized protein n=1 Tax=Porphyridium purpureum TaxID=35688 RepID=A0A5J4YX29_PORPP|nr:hypothetical protein FVE85_1419 [Porphyridium purpureum]|eukprot:POR0089..scf209_3
MAVGSAKEKVQNGADGADHDASAKVSRDLVRKLLLAEKSRKKWRWIFASLMLGCVVVLVLDRTGSLSRRSMDTLHLHGTAMVRKGAALFRTFERDFFANNLDQALKRQVLHDVYLIPDAFLDEVERQDKLHLLFRFLTQETLDVTTKKVTRLLVVQVAHSLNDKLWAMGSALAYAKNTKRSVVILWERDSFFYPSFDEVFAPQEDVIVLEVRDFKAHRVWNPSPNDWARLNWIEHDAIVSGSAPESMLNPIFNVDKNIFIRTGSRLVSEYSSDLPIRRALSSLVPLPFAADRVRKLTDTLRFVQHDSEVISKLYEDFDVPKIMLAQMSRSQRMDLYDQLISMQKELDERLGAANRGKASNAKQHRARVLFAHVQYGLGNRMRALGSAIVFAQKTNRVLVVIWESDHHVEGQFDDFFVNGFVIMDRFPIAWPLRDDGDSKLKTFMDSYNLMKKENKNIKSAASFHLKDSPSKHIYIKTAYIIKSAFTGTDSVKKAKNSPVSKAMQTLTPVFAVQRLVARHHASNLDKMVGVHVRAKTIEKDISKVDPTKEYTSESSKITNLWRKTTSLPVFVAKMASLLSAPNFYVATDTDEALAELDELFPGRIFYTYRRCDDRSATCTLYALADILCLSKTRYILGSHWSSFTEAAVRLGGNGVLLAGVDFGPKPKQGKS